MLIRDLVFTERFLTGLAHLLLPALLLYIIEQMLREQ